MNNFTQNFSKENYNTFAPADNICEAIVNHWFDNLPNLWKLLFYTDRQPLYHDDLTPAQKSNMICKDPTIDGATSSKNILFQKDIDDGISIAIPQIRIRTGDQVPINSYQGYIEIEIQIIVPNKLASIITDFSQVSDRAVQINREITKSLNGKALSESGGNSPLFMNKSAPNGAGRNTGWFRIDNVSKKL